jgi:hypothetical protein
MKVAECSNCHSQRRRVYRAGYCSKCYYWHRKRVRIERELQGEVKENSSTSYNLTKYRIRVAARVLEEYAWREQQLAAAYVHPLALEALVYALAAECRSEVGFAPHSWFAAQSPEARNCFYSVLLAIVENIPSSLPRLHKINPSERGSRRDGWTDWHINFWPMMADPKPLT